MPTRSPSRRRATPARPSAQCSLAEARRLALAAQGLNRPRPARADRRHARRAVRDVALIQIDSVNVLVRSQELPLFARIGAHDRSVLPAMVDDGELFEYWGHEASLIPAADEPLLRWRMRAAADGEMWGGLAELARRRPAYLESIRARLRDEGPIAASDLGRDRRAGPWWDWSDAKKALEYLFWTGEVTARRRSNFERVYDLRERALPADVLQRPTPTRAEAHRALVAKAGRSLGIAWARDLADYYRLRPADARIAIDELVEEGALLPVGVEGIDETAYLDRAASIPRTVDACALVSPFDSLVWERRRTERLFGMRYRLEIYTPAPKRVHGYYVLPFVLGDRLVARVDLKADRQARTLRCLASWIEAPASAGEVAGPLAEELGLLAGWLGLDQVAVGPKGTLARTLRGALPPRPVGGAP